MEKYSLIKKLYKNSNLFPGCFQAEKPGEELEDKQQKNQACQEKQQDDNAFINLSVKRNQP
jgi:hypothetical protein